jgi:hypothetical protein
MSNIGKPERAILAMLLRCFVMSWNISFVIDKSDQRNSNIEENLY